MQPPCPVAAIRLPWPPPADSDDIGHLFQSISDTVPGLSDSCRSEATLCVSLKGVSDSSQDWATVFVLTRSPAEGRRSGRQPEPRAFPKTRLSPGQRPIAAAHQRDRVTLADMTEAIEAWMVPALKDMDAAMKRADAAAADSKSKVRNWRPDTEGQVAAKQGRRRNQIVTSSDLKKTAPHETAAPVPAGLRRSEAALKEAFSAPEETEFPRSRSARVPVPGVSATHESAALVPA